MPSLNLVPATERWHLSPQEIYELVRTSHGMQGPPCGVVNYDEGPPFFCTLHRGHQGRYLAQTTSLDKVALAWTPRDVEDRLPLPD